MREAVIVSTARTPIGKAYRGAFNDTESPSMAAPVIKEAVKRARVEPAEIDDLIMGAALQQGTQSFNVARQCVVAAELPISVAGQSVDRQCSSGLMSISMGAKQIIADGMQTVVAGGLESISLVQNAHMDAYRQADPIVLKRAPAIYMAMIDTAEVVSKRYKISREAQDEYSYQSQQRTFDAQEAGLFNDEIIATTVTKGFDDKKTGKHHKAGSHSRARRMQSARNDARRACCSSAGEGAGRIHYRRQREPTFRRRLGLRPDGAQTGRKARAASAGNLSRDGGRRIRAR